MVPVAVAAADQSHVAAARSDAQRLARSLDFDETRTGRVAIAVTEAVTNMLRHARGGTLFAQSTARGGSVGIEVLAIDSGPGMADFAHSAIDGVSSGSTPGTGLGAMRRMSEEFDVYTREGAGTVLRMAFWSDGKVPPAMEHYEIGSICIPKPGETACGDAWDMAEHEKGLTLVIADGLGHGPEAARASASAVEILHRNPGHPAIRLLDAMHAKLRPTRGAAVAVMRHELAGDDMVFAGVGNIAACFWDGGTRRSMVSHNGIVGHNVHKSVEYHYPWPRGALLVAHSDGLESQWNLDAFPGIMRCHPSLIAAVLFREHSRRRDDTTVVVARRTS